MVLDRTIAHNYYNVERASHLRQKLMMTSQKQRFILKMAKAKNALASGVRCTGWLADFLSFCNEVKDDFENTAIFCFANT